MSFEGQTKILWDACKNYSRRNEMTPASSKTQIIWLEDRIVNLEKRLEQVERLNKAAQPDDDLNNVRYKATYRYETKQPLTDEQIGQLAEQVGLLGPKSRVGNASEATEKFARAIELAHGIGEKDE